MREINPRAWSIDGECWCTRVDYDGYKKEWSGIMPIEAPDNRSKRLGEIEDTNIIVELPTSLKDKNGKEIYEGDIVKQSLVEDPFCNNFPSYIVCWDKEFLGWSLKDASGDEGNDTDLHFFADNSDKIEVIGNIHENPELLEEK